MQLQLLEPMFTGGEDVGPASSVIQPEPQVLATHIQGEVIIESF